MSRYYQRPENALKKANEFIEVGKPTRALDTLYDVIKGKKHRAFSEKVIEPIMLKYLELCVELKKPHTAKEGLYQYRLMCQSVNVGLLEKVIRSFIKMAEERTESARDNLKNKVLLEQSQQAIVEVDDLDNLSMAEMTLLNVITEEQAQERSDRAALIPWVKFLWESYTQCLDLLRNNARLENLYHDIAQMAFKFCLSYNRKTEFRKLCERLRKHFDDIVNRASSQMNSIDFSSPETQQLNMETRLSQLDSAITMELWQEAYKAIEDIHLLMNQSKKSQTRMMAYYYQKLSLVFWKAGNLLFHAATLLKYYMLCKDMKKNVSQDELQKNASQVVLATLAIPFPVVHPEFERFVETDKGMLEKAQKLATLLFLPQPPTRASMIRDLTRYGVLSNAITPLQDLHELLETQFNPLGLCAEVNKTIQTIISAEDNEYLNQYVEALQDVALVRLIKQVSQVYQSIDYPHLLKLTVFTTQYHLEQLLVDAVRYNDMQITVDHRSDCVRFGSSLAEASREDLPEGPHLQAMPSEAVRLQLVNVMNSLEETIEMINPPHLISDEDNVRSKIVQHYMLTEKQNHIQLLQRQKIISERREELERSAVDKENEEKWRNEQMLKQQIIMEQKRLETEREEREKKRMEIEKEEIHKRRLKEKMAQIASTPFGQKVVKKLEEDDLAKLDVETVMLRQQEEMAKEAKEHLARMRAQEKRIDHLERAKRIEEIPVIDKFMKDKKEFEKKEWEAHEKERITHLIEERKIAVANRDRMKRMKEDKEAFLHNLLQSRRHVFEAKLAEFKDRLDEKRAERLQERKEKRKKERRDKYVAEKEEEERRKAEEIRREEEERQRIEQEKIAKELDEKNRITREKQLAKEREIEEREREKAEREKVERGSRVPDQDVWRPTLRAVPSATMERPSATAASAGSAPSGGTATPWVPSRVRKAKDGKEPTEEAEAPPGPPAGRGFTRNFDRDDKERPQERHREFDREDRGFERRTERDREFDHDSDRKRGGGGGERDWGRDQRNWDRDGGDRERSGFSRDGPRGGGRDRGTTGGDDASSWRTPRSDRGGGGGERGGAGERGGDRMGDRGGDRGDRGGDRGGERGGERGGDRGGDRGLDRGGDRDRGGHARDRDSGAPRGGPGGFRRDDRRDRDRDRDRGGDRDGGFGNDDNWRRPPKKEDSKPK